MPEALSMRSRFSYPKILIAIALGLLGGSCVDSEPGPPVPASGSQKLTVVVAVVDSLMPQEITAATPNLNALKTGGTFYAESRAVFSAETIPNHVAMMTGVYPARSGITSNNFIDFTLDPPEERDLSLPEKLTANTLFTWIHDACVVSGVNPELRTGATLSKKYLFEIFEGDAANPGRANDHPAVFNAQPDSYWNPQDDPAYIGSPDEHTPDAAVMDQALSQLPEVDFFFVNLGDVDRSAHAGGPSARAAALTDTDAQVGRLVTALQDAGRWNNTVLFLVSDHGMDFSDPGPASAVSTQSTLDALGACFKPMQAVAGGGTESIYVTDAAATAAERQAAVRATRACLLGTQDCDALCAGAVRPVNAANFIGGAWYTASDSADPSGNMPASQASRHPNFGDLVVFAAPGGKFAEPSQTSANGQIPGNHGHPPTLHNTFLISGGSPWVKKGQIIAASSANPTVLDRLTEQSENVDIAPTVAWLLDLGLDPPEFPDEQGFDGRVLKEAFVQFDADSSASSPTDCGRFD